MKIYEYTISLLDPLFYAREGLSAAFTPPYLHATAINFAVAAALGIKPEGQSYIISDYNGGRNTPRYKNSIASGSFYFTPGRLSGPLRYSPEWTKGENDGFTAKTGMGEVLKAEILNYLPPETEFKGFLSINNGVVFPGLIRLGTFRGKAKLSFEEWEIIGKTDEKHSVNHPVDPLVSRVRRGVMIGMFPYPIVDNAVVEAVYEVRKGWKRAFVAVQTCQVSYDKKILLKRLLDIKPGLSKAQDTSLCIKDRAYLILHMLRTVLSVKLFLKGIWGGEELNAALKRVEGFDSIRLVSKGEESDLSESKLLGILEIIKGLINGCEKEIRGDTESKSSKDTGDGPSIIIL